MKNLLIIILILFTSLGDASANISHNDEEPITIEYLEQQKNAENVALATGATVVIACTFAIMNFWNPAGWVTAAICGASSIIGCTIGESVTKRKFTPTMCIGVPF